HGGVACAVLQGDADVGATFAVYEGGDPRRRLVKAGFSGVVLGRGARVIDVAGPIPADMIVGVSGLDPSVRVAVTVMLQRIAALPGTKEMLETLFNAEGFSPFSPSAV